MRSTLIVGLTGLVAGAVGALLVTRFAPAPAPAPVPPAPAAPVQVPLGLERGAVPYPSFWDRQFSARLASVEARLDNLPSKQPTELASASAEAKPNEKENERASAYEADVLAQQKVVNEHSQEPMDAAWASAQQQTIETAFQPLLRANDSIRRINVDCRSKTCIARVTYATPDDALADHEALMNVRGKGCHGQSSTLQPPLSAGPYEAVSVYHCGQQPQQ